VQQALTARGLPTDLMMDHEFTEEHRAVTAFMHRAHPPTALIVDSSSRCLVVLDALQRLGIHVPAQCSVLVIEEARGKKCITPYTTPPVTAIAYPMDEEARLAVQLLFERLADPTSLQRGEVRRIALQSTLIPRASCAKAPT
jgi:DNA-binding LacI/PurR family transcriptional regulator